MIETLLTLIPSMCWILYRCYKILRTPVKELIEDLNIEIPHTPNICIDSITKNSAIIHWDIEVKLDENLYYVLMINNQEVATITSKSCKLNNLDPSQLYQIQIIAVNSLTNFRSQSGAVFIETIEKSDADRNESLIIGMEMNDIGGLTTISSNPVKQDNSHATSLGGRGSTTDSVTSTPIKFEIDSITVDVVNSTTSPDLLNDYLLAFQNETIKLNLEYQNYQYHMIQESANLKDQLRIFKQEYEEETDSKLRKDSDVKTLERNKDRLNHQKLKLTNQLNTLQSGIEMFNTKLEELEQRILKLKERNTHLLHGESDERQKFFDEINKILSHNETVKRENETIEESLKKSLAEKKDLSGLLAQLKPLAEIFNTPAMPGVTTGSAGVAENLSVTGITVNPDVSAVFNRDGNINLRIFETLEKVFEIVPEWEDEIMAEINNYQESENNWKEAFRAEIKKYLSIHQLLEIAKQNIDKAYQPIKLTEYQASIEFGGFSNALPKSRYSGGGKGYRNFSPNVDENGSNYFNHYSLVYSNDQEGSMDQINTQCIGVDEANESVPSVSTPGSNFTRILPNSINTLGADLSTTASSYVGNNTLANTIPMQNGGFNSGYMEVPQFTSPSIGNAILTPKGEIQQNLLSQPLAQPLAHSLTNPSQLQGFPYDDQIYTSGISSPMQESASQPLPSGQYDLNSLLYAYSPRISNASLNTGTGTPAQVGTGGRGGAWNNLGMNGIFSNDSLTSLHNEPYGVNSAPGNGVDSGYRKAPSTKLWIDGADIVPPGGVREGTPSVHVRNVSNSQIWRDNPNPSTHNFHLGVAEFQPFGLNLSLNGPYNGNATVPSSGTDKTHPDAPNQVANHSNPSLSNPMFYHQFDVNSGFEGGEYYH